MRDPSRHPAEGLALELHSQAPNDGPELLGPSHLSIASPSPAGCARDFSLFLLGLINRAGTLVLRGPLDWPWAAWFERRLAVLRTLSPSTG